MTKLITFEFLEGDIDYPCDINDEVRMEYIKSYGFRYARSETGNILYDSKSKKSMVFALTRNEVHLIFDFIANDECLLSALDDAINCDDDFLYEYYESDAHDALAENRR